MKRLDRMLILAFLGPFLFCFSVVLFILVLQLLGLYADAFGGKGLGGGLFVKMVGLAMGRMLLEAMPLAVMAAAIMSFGRLGENRELTAIQASGISMLKFMRSLIAFGVLLTLISIWLSFDVVPNASQKFYRLLSDIRRTKADLAIKPGIFYTDIDGFAIRVTDQHPENGTLYGVMLYDKRAMPEITVVVADSARMLPQSREDVLRMSMYHGSRHQEFESSPSNSGANQYGRTYFDSLRVFLPLSGFEFSESSEEKVSARRLPQWQLSIYLDSLRKRVQAPIGFSSSNDSSQSSATRTTNDSTSTGDLSMAALKTRKMNQQVAATQELRQAIRRRWLDLSYEYWKRTSVPFYALLFILIGLSLGAILQKGGIGLPALISIALVVVLHLLNVQAKKLMRSETVSPELAAWLPVLLFVPVAAYLLSRVLKK